MPSSLNPSPSPPTTSSFRPKAKVNTDAALRKLASSTSLHTSNVQARSRPNSPFKPLSSSPKARVTAKPTIKTNLEPRQRALTSASPKLKFPHSEDRPRSGSVIALHHALSLSDFNRSSSPTLSHSSPSAERPLVDIRRTNTPPVPPPIKVRSKVTGLLKAASANQVDAASRSLSPPYATMRPIYTRDRAPSITSSFSLNDHPPLAFYPITTASPAANPHRYVHRRAQSPARTYPSPTLPGEPHSARNSSLTPRVDPASVPLPPHSPPISALSLSSMSSVSRTSVSLHTDQTTDQVSSIMSHIKRGSMEWIGQPNPFFPQTRRDRSRSKERGLSDLVQPRESDTDSEGSERHIKAEAKTNRKIADLEITNRSLLAINASLETTKNRQAKEIRDLRRKLRESRLILPPRTFNAVKSAVQDERDRDDEDEDDEDSDIEEGLDETFQRVRDLIDNLIESGRRALETRPEDFRASLATKVLNADELRSWRDFGQRASIRINRTDTHDTDNKTTQNPSSPALVSMPDSDTLSLVESDGELFASDSQGSLPLPPTLTITHS